MIEGLLQVMHHSLSLALIVVIRNLSVKNTVIACFLDISCNVPRPETAELCQWIVETQKENWEKEEAIIREEFNISPDVALEDVNLFEGKGWFKRKYSRLRFLVKMLHCYKKARHTKLASPRPRIHMVPHQDVARHHKQLL